MNLILRAFAAKRPNIGYCQVYKQIIFHYFAKILLKYNFAGSQFYLCNVLFNFKRSRIKFLAIGRRYREITVEFLRFKHAGIATRS